MTIKTKCIQCGRTYINYNDLCTVCRKVEQSDLRDIDAINIEAEQDIIYNEIEEQTRKDFPRPKQMARKKTFKGFDLRKMPYPDYMIKKGLENQEAKPKAVDVTDESG